MPSHRNPVIDNLRGALMAYVVIVIHGIFFLNLAPLEFGALMLFEMPAIFVVSGYAYRMWETSRPAAASNGYAAFLFSRYVRILGPYLCYALVCATLAVRNQAPPDLRAVLGIYANWLNPFTYGSAHTFGTLNWHLWFVPVFLLTTALLPFAARLLARHVLVLGLLALALFAFQWQTRHLDHQSINFLRQSLTYLFFSVAGYALARHGSGDGARTWLFLAAGALFALLLQEAEITDMQEHKFQANHIFLLFSIAWIAAFYFAAKWSGRLATLMQARDPWLLRPFITAGYSIYLWQGLGYTLAILASARFGLSPGTTLAVAVGLSVLLGIAVSPVERLRWRPSLVR